MLKKYAEPNHLRLVGKAWEIRSALRQEQKARGGNAALSELLPPNRPRAVIPLPVKTDRA